ncbi:MAG: PTS sugar transporter subunit IIA [Kiritimatiellaeota bacterium]|nr:PTS sugar transporter subunit IIA [Kiritimatiellota bacterium]
MQWSIRDVAERLNVSERTVLRWVKHDGLPASRIGSQFRFNRAELLEWATAHKLKVPPALFYGENEERERMPSFSDALSIGGIFHEVGGTDKPSVLRAIVNLLRLPDGVDRELLYRMLMAREALASTAVGDGIAIPHPRNPIVLRVTQPLVTLCLLAKPVDFGALDGQPVYALFTLVSSAPRIHLHLLARLSYVLRQSSFKTLISGRGSAADILAEVRRVEASIKSAATTEQKDSR